jgi:hypothetical protein
MHRRLRSLRLPAATLAAVGVAAFALGIALAAPNHAAHAPRAGQAVSCPGRPGPPNVVTTAPDPRLAANLAILRRPATPADTPDPQARRAPLDGRGPHLADARLLRADIAGKAWIVPVDDVRPQLPKGCEPGVVIISDGPVDVGPSITSLDLILAGNAVETNSCAGPSHDMLGVDALLPDGATQPYLRFGDGHTVLGDLRDNAVTFVINKPDQRSQLPTAIAWTDATAGPRTSPINGGAFTLEHCAPR